MSLVVWDVDYTIVRCDSEQEFCTYLHRIGRMDDAGLERQRLHFDQYLAGELDPEEGSRNIISALVGLTQGEVDEICRQYIASEVIPHLCPFALARIAWHRTRGDTLMLASATTAFIIDQLGEHLEVDHVIATRAEIVDGKVSGNIVPPPAMGEGKARLVREYAANHALSLKDCWVYTDSRNDFPVLELARTKVAVNPDTSVRKEAMKNHWEVCDWATDCISIDR